MEKRQVYIGGFKEFTRLRLPKKGVFVAHDFFGDDEISRESYRTVFEDAFARTNYQPIYAPIQSGTILETLTQSMVNTDAGIFDVSVNRPYNANVLIELGVSLGMNHPSLVIAKDDGSQLLDFLEALKPLRYRNENDLVKRIAPAVEQIIQIKKRLNPYYCVICGQDNCDCRKRIPQEMKTYALFGADIEDDGVERHTAAIARDFQLRRIEVEGDLSSALCNWLYAIRRSQFVFFYSKALGKDHHGVENAATMVQLGLAVSAPNPWRIIVPSGEFAPTDVSAFMSVQMHKQSALFRGRLNSAVGVLLNEHNPYFGHYDPLEPPLEVPIEEEVKSIDVEAPATSAGKLYNVPPPPAALLPNQAAHVQEIVDALLSGEMVTVTGVGGVGKTALAAFVAHHADVQQQFSGGVFWLDGNSFRELATSLSGIQRILLKSDPVPNLSAGSIPTFDELLMLFQGVQTQFRWVTAPNERILFVVDGYETTSTAADRRVIDEFGRMQTPRSSVLLTTRSVTVPGITISLDEQPEQRQVTSTGHVFISYSRKNEAMTRRIIDVLEKSGVAYWVDNQLTPGTPNWSRQIQAALEQASALIVLLSPDSRQSEWVQEELTLARIHQKPIFPVLVEGDVASAIPLGLISNQYLDARGDKLDSALIELGLQLKQIIPSPKNVLSETDPLLEQAIAWARELGDVSASLLQRQFNVGYPRAVRLIQFMEELGVVSPAQEGSKTREVLHSDEEELYQQAVSLVRQLNKASVSLLQRRFRIGYTRAARLIDLMEERGIVGPAVEGAKPREVLPLPPSQGGTISVEEELVDLEDDADHGEVDEALFNEAVSLVRKQGRASVSLLQRKMRIGYTRAARLIDLMEERGIVGSAPDGIKPREVLLPPEEDDSNN